MTAISLFTSGGIGDLAVREAGFKILVSNELRDDRHAVFEANFPCARVITGDIWESLDSIEEAARLALAGRELGLLYATPPCQGMSKNGRGKLLSAIRSGRKSPLDERNRLIIPTMQLARRLRPHVVLLENVPEMADTLILDDGGEAIRILDYIERELGEEYSGKAEVVEFANYGVPQCRQRLITIYSRNSTLQEWASRAGTLLPAPTHDPIGMDGKEPWITVRQAIGDVPPLDAKTRATATSETPFHRVPMLDEMKYWWVDNTLPEKSAFDNQCSECGYGRNPMHGANRDAQGINRASKETPLFCKGCGALLPRPSVERNGKRVLMRGFTSAYKRMSYDKPASALTRNLSYACSDNKLHPEQNRVLSLYEAFRIHTIDRFDYEWRRSDGRVPSDKTIREIIGESIPPHGLLQIVRHLVEIISGGAQSSQYAHVGPLFEHQRVGI